MPPRRLNTDPDVGPPAASSFAHSIYRTLPIVTQAVFSPRYASTKPVMYSASRSLMARISNKVKGSGRCAQLAGQFAVEEMISVTRACRVYGCWEWHGLTLLL